MPYQLRIMLNVLATIGWIATVIRYVMPANSLQAIVFILWMILMCVVYCADVYLDAKTVRVPNSLIDGD